MEREREKTKQYTIPDLIEGVFKRPAMYVGEHRFCTAIAFLEGFFSALQWSGAAPEDVSDWDGFHAWLHKKTKCPMSISVMHRFRNSQPDDETAFSQLAAYWSEYQSSKQGHLKQKKPRGGAAVE
jgi:hypothetical protein